MALDRISYRVGQGLRHLTGKPNTDVDVTLQALLTPDQWQLMKRLSPADRAHLLKVHQALIQQGHTDPDLLLAALLHDIGKADERGRVTIVHRTLKVLIASVSPSLLSRLARKNGGWIAHGMYLAVYHPMLGAELVRKAGASERTCWFIERHDDGTISGDRSLQALQQIDAEG